MPLFEDLSKRQNIPTVPDTTDVGRRGRVSETVKDVFTWELRNYFSTTTTSRVDAVPSVDKFTAYLPGQSREQDPYETVVRILRQFPDLTQKMPFVGIAAKGFKNHKMSLSGKFVDVIRPRPYLIAGQGPFGPPGPITIVPPLPATWPDSTEPSSPTSAQYPIGQVTYGLVAGDFVQITTIIDGITRVSTITFTQSLLGVAPQTPRLVADIINIQSLYATASIVFVNGIPTLILSAGGPGAVGVTYSIQRTGSSANFDANINFATVAKMAPSNEFPAMNRYMMSYTAEMGLMIVTEDENTRSELVDLLMDYFCFVMDDRQFTYYGRSFFGDQVDEAYQIIIRDNDISTSGEQEVARQDDPTRKYYINSITIPVLANQYIDRNVSMGVTVTPSILPTPG